MTHQEPIRYFTNEQIERRYPRLIRVMQAIAVLAHTEAVCAIRDHLWNRKQAAKCSGYHTAGCEAVAHYSSGRGPQVVLKRASEEWYRHAWASYWKKKWFVVKIGDSIVTCQCREWPTRRLLNLDLPEDLQIQQEIKVLGRPYLTLAEADAYATKWCQENL